MYILKHSLYACMFDVKFCPIQLSEKCFTCGEDVVLSHLREHVNKCSVHR